MNISRLARNLAMLMAISVAACSAAWAERGNRDRNARDNERREQQRDIPAPSFQHRSTREWSSGPDYRNEHRDQRRNGRSDDYRSRELQGRFYDDRGRASGYDRRRGQRPVNDVIREVQDRYGGQVIGVQQSGGDAYRVRVLQRDGRVRNVLVPAE
jgi:hypothetical protein